MISLCMITWNEEELLPVAIGSTTGLADEIIIVDTGSTDKTIETAKNLGCKVITGADRMHKAKARNTAIEAAAGDWIVILDADEQIADPVGLRQFLEITEAQAVYITLSYMDANDQPTLSYKQMRCWRCGTYRYKYRAHEVPLPINGWGNLEYTNFVWEHRPIPERSEWKRDYTLQRLLLDVEENPGEMRPVYYLGRQYMYRGEWAEAMAALQKYLSKPGFDQADAWANLAKCYGQLNRQADQIKALFQACAAQPARREWWCDLASLYYQQGKYQLAVGLLKCALEIPLPERSYTNHYWYGAAIYDLLARSLWKLKRYEEGLTYARQAYQLQPDERLQRNVWWFESALGDMDAFYRLYGPDVHHAGRHQIIADLVKGPKVLDVGCGTGDLLMLLQDQNFDLFGTDKSQVALDMATERGVKANLQHSESLPSGTFDTIIMSQVLEHLENDAGMVAEVADHLKPGGLFIVSVPENGKIKALDHKREYTEQSLTKLLNSIGQPQRISWNDNNRILMTVEK